VGGRKYGPPTVRETCSPSSVLHGTKTVASNEELGLQILENWRNREPGWCLTCGVGPQISYYLIVKIPEGSERPIMKGAQFTATIDYVRAVHAEMAAITDAARNAVATAGAELYTTTFPCHDCAKHIVAAGIKRVVYIEPYPKSLVPDLYSDSVVVDTDSECGTRVRVQPFVGIAPKRYAEWFALMKRKRKLKDGTVVAWRPNEAVPQLPESAASAPAWLSAEAEEFKRFENELVSATKQEDKK
jgi:deoxycytidylate deaminase